MNNGPVGVFDSGMGGLSVLKALTEVIPTESYLYYGDSQNAPYGVRSDEEVYELSCNAFEELISRGAKAIVVACNTATSVAILQLRAKYPRIPVIGMEPAIKPAVEQNPDSRVVVMATPVTLRGAKFSRLMERFSDKAEIISMPSPEIVRYVEEGRLHDEELKQYVRGLFDDLEGDKPVEAVVLGCTHFPFAAHVIREAAGPEARLYDGNRGTAEELLRKLRMYDLLSDGESASKVEILNSAGQEKIDLSWKLFLGEK